MTRPPAHQTLQAQLEALFVNNADFDRLAQALKRFNPIRVMKMERMEIRHSAILAWLLDPSETHGMGDQFLKAFLAEAFRGTNVHPNALMITQSDLRDAEILREKNNMDLFVTAPSLGWAFVIENKLGSRQHSNQLKRYSDNAKKIAASQGKEFQSRGIFLTLEDEALMDKDKPDYVPLRYYQLCTILRDLVQRLGAGLDVEARKFIEYYLEIIEELCGMSETTQDMKDLAAKLFRSHQAALEFIIEHGSVSGFSAACDSYFGEDRQKGQPVRDGLIYSGSSSTRFVYIPESWRSQLENSDLNAGCADWNSGFALGCWFDLRKDSDGVKGKLFLNFEVGPVADPEARRQLIDALSEIGGLVKFSAVAKRESTKYSRFLTGNGRNIDDIGNPDAIIDAMGKLQKKFAGTTQAVADVLGGISEQRG